MCIMVKVTFLVTHNDNSQVRILDLCDVGIFHWNSASKFTGYEFFQLSASFGIDKK